jgi:hypothetical protein
MSPGFKCVARAAASMGSFFDGQLLLVRGPPMLQHRSEVGEVGSKVIQPDAAHEHLDHVESGRHGAYVLASAPHEQLLT